MKIALIQDNKVVEIKDFASEEALQEVAMSYQLSLNITDSNPVPQVGWVFNGSILVPGEGQSATYNMKITKLAIRQRLTLAELVGIYSAIPTNPVLQVLMDNLKVATFIDLNRPDTISGVMYLVSVGLLTLERAQAILTTPPSAAEAYHETNMD